MILKCVLLVYGFPLLISAGLDLYVARDDAKNLLGVPSQIWYVQNGKVKTHALNYVIKVPTNVNILTFQWQNKQSSTMPYSLQIEYSNSHAIRQPRLQNIKLQGLVPNQLSSWSVILNCTGNFITQSHVNLTLQVPLTHSLQNITTLTIQRKKICSEKYTTNIAVEPLHKNSSTNIVYVTISILGIFLITVAALAAGNHIRFNKLRMQAQRQRVVGSERVNFPNNQRIHLEPKITVPSAELRHSPLQINKSSVTTTTTNVTNHHIEFKDPREGDIGIKLIGLKGTCDNLELVSLQAEGTFGRVYNGTYRLCSNSNPISVVVKTVSDCTSEIQRGVFIYEGVMLASLCHKNVLPIIAAITEPEKPPLLVFQSNSLTNLKRYLMGCHTLLTRDVVNIGSQVVEALIFLHSKQLVHKDVATRNCVVEETMHLKLGDCALSKDLFPGDYHCLGDNENRPVKWLAIESLVHKTFSSSSDVWSWGVLLWEVMTLGQQPYVEIDPFEIATVLRQGVRLAQPINCPDQLFKAMTSCWASHPRDRPTVEELLTYLLSFLEHLDRYV